MSQKMHHLPFSHFTLIFILLFLLLPSFCPQEAIVSRRISKDYAPYWFGKLAIWPTKLLKVDAIKYGAGELKDWYCVTGKTKLKLAHGKIKIDADANVVIETLGWGKQPHMLMLNLLVNKGTSEFFGTRRINRADGIDESCFLDDNPEQFGANQGDQFRQPKDIDESMAASKTKGIMVIGQILPFPIDEKCKDKVYTANMVIQESEYKLLIHKNDVESGVADTLEDCLNKPTEETPTTTITTAITTTTTMAPTNPTPTSTGPTTTTKKGPRTKWTFAPNKIVGFLDRITPFPPGYKAKLD